MYQGITRTTLKSSPTLQEEASLLCNPVSRVWNTLQTSDQTGPWNSRQGKWHWSAVGQIYTNGANIGLQFTRYCKNEEQWTDNEQRQRKESMDSSTCIGMGEMDLVESNSELKAWCAELTGGAHLFLSDTCYSLVLSPSIWMHRPRSSTTHCEFLNIYTSCQWSQWPGLELASLGTRTHRWHTGASYVQWWWAHFSFIHCTAVR